MEPRCGKTKAVLDAVAINVLLGRIKRVTVCCPLGALSVWEDEMEEHFPLHYAYRQADDNEWLGHKDPQVYFFLLNYDKFRQRTREGKRWVYEWAHGLEKWRPDLIVEDESHRAKGAGTVTAQTLWRSIRRMRKARGDGRPWVYLMTGTPNPKSYVDLFAQFRTMDDTIFGTNKADFEDRHCEYGQQPHNKYKVIRYRHKRELLEKVRAHSSIITRAKAFPDGEPELPPVSVRIALPPRVRQMYDELVEEGLLYLEDGEVIEGLTPAVLRLRCQQLTGGFTTKGRVIHKEKLKMAKDILTDLRALEEPTVVYARFLSEVHAIRDAAEDVGFRATSVHGGVKPRDRAAAYKTLKDKDKPACLVFQVQTGSLAIDLSAASEGMFYSFPDNFVDYWQAVSRLFGPKQKKSVRIRHLIASGTVDVRQLQGLREKSDLHGELMGNPRGFLLGL
jgi:SNF2 family DNA or RNA helicase